MTDKWIRLSHEDLETLFANSVEKLVDTPGRKIFRHGDFVIKFGGHIDLTEAETILSVHKMDQRIPVPTVVDYYTEDTIKAVVLNHIPGVTLASVWPNLSMDEKQSYISQIRDLVGYLRQHEGDFIGSLQSGPAVNLRRFPVRDGPFKDEASFNDFLFSDIAEPVRPRYEKQVRQGMKADHRILLAHGDIRMDNFLVRDGVILAWLDWECAGYYPEYWDVIKFYNGADFRADWTPYADQIFPDLYPAEFFLDSFMNRITRH